MRDVQSFISNVPPKIAPSCWSMQRVVIICMLRALCKLTNKRQEKNLRPCSVIPSCSLSVSYIYHQATYNRQFHVEFQLSVHSLMKKKAGLWDRRDVAVCVSNSEPIKRVHTICYRHCVVRRYPKDALFNLLKSIITTWQAHKLLTCNRH